jgi:hypothetical protein
VLTLLFLPAGLALSIAAVVVGVRSRKRARRVLAPAPGAVAGIVMGTIGLVVCLSQIGLYAVMWDDFNGYVKCRESALTIEDKKACQDQWLPRIERRLHLPKDSLRQHPSWY